MRPLSRAKIASIPVLASMKERRRLMLDVEEAREAAMEAAMASSESIMPGIDADGSLEEFTLSDHRGTPVRLFSADKNDSAMTSRRLGPSLGNSPRKVPDAVLSLSHSSWRVLVSTFSTSVLSLHSPLLCHYGTPCTRLS